jgi:hypothetical protein
MTIVEIEDTLPSGLHDAFVKDVFVDFMNKMARFSLDVDVGNPDAPTVEECDATRPGILTISGLFFFIVEPYRNYIASRSLYVTGAYSIKPEDLPVKIANAIPENVFLNVIYTDRSAIYIAGENAAFEWIQ